MLTVKNVTSGETLVTRGRIADRPWSRMRGLIGSRPLEPGEGLWITPCNGIHMLFMSFAIDVIYLDRELTVVEVSTNVQPWHTGRFVRGARSVLELPAGAISATTTKIGDRVRIDLGHGE